MASSLFLFEAAAKSGCTFSCIFEERACEVFRFWPSDLSADFTNAQRRDEEKLRGFMGAFFGEKTHRRLPRGLAKEAANVTCVHSKFRCQFWKGPWLGKIFSKC